MTDLAPTFLAPPVSASAEAVASREAPAQEIEAQEAETPNEQEPFDAERAQAKIRKANSEAQGLRERLKALEPLAAEAEALRQASKTDLERLSERSEAAEQRAAKAEGDAIRWRVAAIHGIAEEDFDFLGTGTEDEIVARAERLAAKNAAAKGADTPTVPPAARRPVDQLRPGATPTTPLAVNEAYPAEWLSPTQKSQLPIT